MSKRTPWSVTVEKVWLVVRDLMPADRWFTAEDVHAHLRGAQGYAKTQAALRQLGGTGRLKATRGVIPGRRGAFAHYRKLDAPVGYPNA